MKKNVFRELNGMVNGATFNGRYNQTRPVTKIVTQTENGIVVQFM